MFIAQCTNECLKMLQAQTNKSYLPPDKYEIMIVLGVHLIMSYNRVPSLADYWSSNPSLKNEAIKSAIARDRFLLISSKMYYNHPEKPEGAGKLYYIEEIVSCLKYT